MVPDLYNFTENDYFKEMIVDDGVYLAIFKTLFLIFIYILTTLPLKGIEHWTSDGWFTITGLAWITVLLFFNFFAVIKYSKPLYFQHKSKLWVKKEANIKKLYISKRFSPIVSIADTEYIPTITYEYIVHGKKYIGKRLSFNTNIDHDHTLDNGTSSKYHDTNKDFSLWLDKKKVEIYYNPKKPNESVIYNKLKGWYYYYLFMTIVPLMLGGTFLLALIHCALFR